MQNPHQQRNSPTENPAGGVPESVVSTLPFPREAALFSEIGARQPRGFTLIELLIALAIVVILTIAAIPSFNSLIYSNKLTSTSNDMVAALNSARLEAVKRNATVQLCSNSAVINTTDTLGTACGTHTGAVYLWPAAASSAIQVLAEVGGIVSPLQVSGTVQALRFNGQGLAQSVGSTSLYVGPVSDICTAAISTDNHRIVEMIAGSIITTKKTTRSCP